ncbi:UNVERIFIED_CONTAM: hypothetical protein GTU68_037012 [Idotea baltica]|nr:hypothetical protein [Idotea baltica]
MTIKAIIKSGKASLINTVDRLRPALIAPPLLKMHLSVFINYHYLEPLNIKRRKASKSH